MRSWREDRSRGRVLYDERRTYADRAGDRASWVSTCETVEGRGGSRRRSRRVVPACMRRVRLRARRPLQERRSHHAARSPFPPARSLGSPPSPHPPSPLPSIGSAQAPYTTSTLPSSEGQRTQTCRSTGASAARPVTQAVVQPADLAVLSRSVRHTAPRQLPPGLLPPPARARPGRAHEQAHAQGRLQRLPRARAGVRLRARGCVPSSRLQLASPFPAA